MVSTVPTVHLFTQFALGEDAAFAPISEFWRPHLVSYFMRQGLSVALSDELAAESLQKMFESRIRKRTFVCPNAANGEAALRGWVRTLARRVLIDYARRNRREVPVSSLTAETDQERISLLEQTPADEPTPEAVALAPLTAREQEVRRRHCLRLLARCLERLTPEQRMVVICWKGGKRRPLLGSLETLEEVAAAMQVAGFSHVSVPSLSRYGRQAWETIEAFFQQEAKKDASLRLWLRSWAA